MTEQTTAPAMSADEVLDELVDAAKAFAKCPNPSAPQTPDEWMAQSKWRDARDRLREARTAVAALIARNAELEKERGALLAAAKNASARLWASDNAADRSAGDDLDSIIARAEGCGNG
jgi:hypothetical protein